MRHDHRPRARSNHIAPVCPRPESQSSSLNAIITFNEAFTILSLQSLQNVVYGEAGSGRLLSGFFSSFQHQGCNDRLSKLDIRESEAIRRSLSDGIIQPEDVKSFFHFTALTIFRLDLHCTYEITDILCLEIARAWPQMLSLHLDSGSEKKPVFHTFPSLLSLTYFATLCPNLRTLGIIFNAAEWQGDEDVHVVPDQLYGVLARQPSKSRIGILKVGSSPIRSPFQVTRFLTRILPSLKHVYAEYFLA